MRKTVPHKLEAGRVRTGPYRTDFNELFYGQFFIQGPCGIKLCIICSPADDPESCGWEHVSVSTVRRIPNWIEMSFVKDLCWEPEECVVQFHPPVSNYVNNHAYCLHMWRNPSVEFPQPPSHLVGDKDYGLIKSPQEAAEVRERFEAKHGK